VTAENLSDQAIENAVIAFYNGDAELYSETLPTLAPYESKDINFLWDYQAVKYKVKVTVDSQEVLEEFDEDNNEYELNLKPLSHSMTVQMEKIGWIIRGGR